MNENYQKETYKGMITNMNNIMTLYLSSRLDRLSLEKDELLSSLNSKTSKEIDPQLIVILNYKNPHNNYMSCPIHM